jgi:5'-3' exonuclease
MQDGILNPTGHVFGMYTTITNILSNPKYSRVICVRDLRPDKKIDMYATYKEQRKESKSGTYNVHKDFTGIASLFNSPSVSFVEYPGYEADDVIVSLTKALSPNNDVIIFSGDNDLLPLLLLKGVTISRELHDYSLTPLASSYWIAKYDVPLECLGTYKVLTGDSSDNIGGVPRIPKKLAKAIATDLPDFKEFPAKYNSLMATHGTTPRLREFIINIRQKYNELLDIYTVFFDVLNITVPLENLSITSKRFTIPEAFSYYRIS